GNDEDLPPVTIIVPCYNEQETLRGTIDSLLALTYPKEKLSLVIVDDGSTDQTLPIAQACQAAHPTVQVYSQSNQGKYAALNHGLQYAHTPLIGCMDADSFVDPNALREIVRYFGNPSVMAVAPAIGVHKPATLFQHIQRAEYLMGMYLRKMQGLLNGIHVMPGPFSIFKKEVFDALGGYREGHGTEDLEIALRMRLHHYRIENAHLAKVYTMAPPTFVKLYRQRVRWTQGFLQNAMDYRTIFLNPAYRHLGLFVLPAAVVSVFGSLYLTVYSAIRLFALASDKIVELHTIGFVFRAPEFTWFYLNTTVIALVIYTLIGCSILMVLLGKHLTKDKTLTLGDLFSFLLLYGFFAPFWIAKAVFNTCTRTRAAWK
ncbi:MAG: glycosyltransferase family 2 protein, partial [Candidatus Wildermuthbacteria bacterium]|nr:glycosyltransferase family 2 protein [Candidatus Wildermuthbacteria bacterium]